MNGTEFGEKVCETLGLRPDLVRSVVIEARPDEDLIITLIVWAHSEEVSRWVESENVKNADRVVLIEIPNKEMIQ